MTPNLVAHMVVWAVLATIVVALALYRRRIYMKSDEIVHLMDAEAPLVAGQATAAQKLEKLDRWGKILTAVVILYAVGIAGYYLYKSFTDTSIRM